MKKYAIRIVIVLLCLIIPVFGIFAGFSYSESKAAVTKKQNGVPLPIIMYHNISNRKGNRWILSESEFEKDLIYYRNNGYTSITVADLINFKENSVSLPAKPVMLTFDDGSRTNYTNAFPLLKKYNTKAVMSIVGSFIDKGYKEDGTLDSRYNSSLTYEMLGEMINSGLVEIQNHTYDMHKTKGRNAMKKKLSESYDEYEKALGNDLKQLDNRLIDKLGIETTAVAFPFGSYTKKHSFRALENLGYKAAFTCHEGINYINRNSDLLMLKRYNRDPKRSAEKILAKLDK